MLKPDTIKIQENLAMYCRTGNDQDIPGVTEGRLPHYRRLVNNVVHGTIDQAFPITRKVLSEEEWNYLIDSFFIEHDAQTPILWKLPYEFYQYIREQDHAGALNKAWLDELLWFEWLEIEVHMMPDHKHGSYKHKGDLLTDPLVINKDGKLIKLQYPVHLYPIHEVEAKRGDFFLFIYREQESGSVRFTKLSVLHAWLLDTLFSNPGMTVEQLFPLMIETFRLEDMDRLKNNIYSFLIEMKEAGVILGFRIK